MVLTRERERQLIRLIQEKDDELALRELFASYRPLVGSVISRYFMELYDHQDWEQEALILCYRAAKRFDLKQEKPFAGFYKASLHNRIVNLIRRVKRQKHLAASAQVYWDDAAGELAADPRLISQARRLPLLDWQELVESLSLLELEELLLQLGQRQSAEICRHYQISETRLKRAKYRVKAKFAQKLLLEE